jgi:hypothetical protein
MFQDDQEQMRAQLLADLQQTQEQVVRLLQSMAHVQDWQPEPAEWSFRYIAAHLATVEQQCHLRRVRQIASGKSPHFAHYTNRGTDFAYTDLRDSLETWISTRQKLIEFVQELSTSELHFIGVHEKVGARSLLEELQEIVEQDQGNLRHVYQLIIAYHEEEKEAQ